MRKIIRTFLFIILALYSTQYLIGAFEYQEKKTLLSSILALVILYIFLKPLISLISLPTKGSVFFLISFVTTAIIFYVLMNFLEDFVIIPVTLPSLKIFGFVLPSKDLDSFWSMVFSALTTSTVYLFLEGLCNRK